KYTLGEAFRASQPASGLSQAVTPGTRNNENIQECATKKRGGRNHGFTRMRRIDTDLYRSVASVKIRGSFCLTVESFPSQSVAAAEIIGRILDFDLDDAVVVAGIDFFDDVVVIAGARD